MKNSTKTNNFQYLIALLVISGILFTACSESQTNAFEEQTLTQSEPDELVLDALAPDEEELHALFEESKAKRRNSGEIAHYQFDVRLGSGPFDVVRIHRVVKERRPFRPVRTRGNVFMTHGASNTFEAIFLNSGSDDPTPETSIVLYLAENNIDVWGLDFAWTKVPEGTTDFSFFESWGIEKDVSHTLASMSVARFFRGFSGQGFGPMNLLGFSYGAAIAYVAAGNETQQHRLFRDISGIIPVDLSFKTPDPENSPNAPCQAEEVSQSLLDAGTYENNLGIVAGTVSSLAKTQPDESSPIIPGFTNYQTALAIGVFPSSGRAFWHFVAGDIDSDLGVPVGLLYSDPHRWIQLLGELPPYMPERARYDVAVTACGTQDVTLDDYLGDIKVPIYYLGAAGGSADEGEYTTTLTASTDITTHIVTVANDPLLDYGHADLFLGDNASVLVWEKLHSWLANHDKRGHPPFAINSMNTR